jgi:hypothetical protein
MTPDDAETLAEVATAVSLLPILIYGFVKKRGHVG